MLYVLAFEYWLKISYIKRDILDMRKKLKMISFFA
jgi:hypothetical protein